MRHYLCKIRFADKRTLISPIQQTEITMASADTSDLDKYLEQNNSRIHDELFEFLRIPSVSARSEHNADTSRAAEWIRQSAEKAGMKAKLHPTSGHPIVIAEWRGSPDAPTALIYGHYDVQPAEPLELWESGPWEAAIREGYENGKIDFTSAPDEGTTFRLVLPSLAAG